MGRARETGGNSQFHRTEREPTEKEIKKLVGLVAASAVETCMSNHFYTVGGEVRLQTEGGAIGSDLTGEVSRLYMLQWDHKLREKCRKLGIIMDLYRRYVDDMLIVMRAVGRGWSYNRKKNILEYSPNNIREEPDSARTARVIAEVANSIEDGIQVTTDTPEGNQDNWIPVLDLKVRVSQDTRDT